VSVVSGVLARLRQPQAAHRESEGAEKDRNVTAPAELAEPGTAIAREIFYALESFLLSTDDLDTAGILRRIQEFAGRLSPETGPATIQEARAWAGAALPTFAGLQREYVGAREEEMWRLLDTYAAAEKQHSGRNEQVLAELRTRQDRLQSAVSLDDLRLARETLEEELRQSRELVDRKAREDKERIARLQQQVTQLQQSLVAVRGRADLDALTGLLHQGSLRRRLPACLIDERPCAVAFVDFDDFRRVNATLGHEIGDRVLLLVADQLRRASRTTDLLARFHADRFCFVAPGNSVEQFLQRAGGALSRRHVRLDLGDRVISVLFSVSTGVATRRPGESPNQFLDRADWALREAKRVRRGSVLQAPTVLPSET